eukprot:TRINITY_DN55969_c0_g1_i1.p1 TRINITY_DN55969_c0_g1~~TRINITY_DN55969_c0_g1_i1.p1  ORF type:complete len:222 (-),score=24.83 TRINITY_DN55969_c0_g1_i1:75-740(-)
MNFIVSYLACMFFIIFFFVGVFWLWSEFVDNNDPSRIRLFLYFFLVVQTSCEVLVCCSTMISGCLMIFVLLSNGWGMLDAFLRYPAISGTDRVFVLKQVSMLAMKLIGYTVFFRDIGHNVWSFLLIAFFGVFTLPIVLLTALCVGDVATYHSKHGSVDRDIALRLWNLLRKPAEREFALMSINKTVKQEVVRQARSSQRLNCAIACVNPSLARVVSRPSVV